MQNLAAIWVGSSDGSKFLNAVFKSLERWGVHIASTGACPVTRPQLLSMLEMKRRLLTELRDGHDVLEIYVPEELVDMVRDWNLPCLITARRDHTREATIRRRGESYVGVDWCRTTLDDMKDSLEVEDNDKVR